MKQYIPEAELRVTKEILDVKGRVDRLEEQRGLIRQCKVFASAVT
jgi:hypothetical protein